MVNGRYRGITSIECLAVAACIGASGVMAAVSQAGFAGQDANPRSQKDAFQLRDLMVPLAVFADANDNRFPRPGLIDRMADAELGEVPGVGDEDVTANTTANLYAALIAQRYIAPEAIVSPVERNPHVAVDRDYDYDRYNPVEDTYWDPAFAADLSKESNTSYAHLPMFGERMEKQWRVSGDADFASFGSRGPVDGKPNPDSHTCDPHGYWSGNLLFNDGHIEFRREFTTEVRGKSDNLFAYDDGIDGDDIILTFTRAMGEKGPETQFD